MRNEGDWLAYHRERGCDGCMGLQFTTGSIRCVKDPYPKDRDYSTAFLSILGAAIVFMAILEMRGLA